MFANLKQTLSETKSEVQNLPPVVVGDELLVFSINLADQEGQPKTAGHSPKDIDVRIKSCEGDKSTIETIDVVACNSDSYMVSCKLTQVGQYKISIRLQGKELHGFPREIHYKEGERCYYDHKMEPTWSFGAEGKDEKQFSQPRAIWVHQETPTGPKTVFVVDSKNHRVQIFDGSNGNFLAALGSKGSRKGQMKNPLSISLDSKGNIVVGEEGGDVHLFNPSLGLLSRVSTHHRSLSSAVLNEKDGSLITAGNRLLIRYDVATGDMKGDKKECKTSIVAMALDTTKNLLYCCEYDSEPSVLVLDPDTLAEAGTPVKLQAYATSISLDHLGNIVAAMPNQDVVQIIDPSTSAVLKRIETPSPNSAAVAMDGTIYVVSARDNKVVVF